MTWRERVRRAVDDVASTRDEPHLQGSEQRSVVLDEHFVALESLHKGGVQRHRELPRRQAPGEGCNVMRSRLCLRQSAGSSTRLTTCYYILYENVT